MVAGAVGQDAGGRVIVRCLLLVALVSGPTSLRPQEPSTLSQVDALVMAGRTEDAREVLMVWWDRADVPAGSRQRAPTARADLQHATWLRAVLTVDPAQAAVDYQRLVVEYPGGPYSDRALLRLAQAAEALGDMVRAREHLRVLLRDYPMSLARLDAGRMLRSVEPAAEAQATDHGGRAVGGPGWPGRLVDGAARCVHELRARPRLEGRDERGFHRGAHRPGPPESSDPSPHRPLREPGTGGGSD